MGSAARLDAFLRDSRMRIDHVASGKSKADPIPAPLDTVYCVEAVGIDMQNDCVISPATG